MKLIKQVLEAQQTAGFKLEQEEEFEDDNVKLFHYITDPHGKKHWLDHSPYERIDQGTFADYVAYFKAHGRFPTRDDLNLRSPLTSSDVVTLVNA